METRKPNVLVGSTGSIGAKDTVEICHGLLDFANVRLIPSTHAKPFFDEARLRPEVEVFTDESEWYIWKKRGDKVLHIELRNWADIYVVAPLTAHTLAKFANGLCDNLLTTVFRAWELGTKPILVAPSMNKFMWFHPSTAEHLNKLRSWNIEVMEPRSKLLAGGDVGPAALPTPETVVERARETLGQHQGLLQVSQGV